MLGSFKILILAIDEAFKAAPPAGSRIISGERVQRALEVLASIIHASDEDGPSIIIKDYLLGEKEKTQGKRVGGAKIRHREPHRLSNDYPAHSSTDKQSITTN